MNLFEANIIIAIQKLSCSFLDFLFYFITLIGSEYFFLAIAAVIFWCVNKRYGYKFFSVFIMGQFVVGVIKFIVSRPRPYTQEGIESIFEKTDGGSFPSGHSHNAANMSAQLCLAARLAKNSDNAGGSNNSIVQKVNFKKTVVVCMVTTVLVMFSRLYLGQHYLTDVICGALLGVICAMLFSYLFEMLKNREELLFLAVLPLTTIATIVCLALGKNPESIVKVLAIFGAMSLGYFLEKKYVNYCVNSGMLYKQLIKVAVGVVVLLLIKEGIGLIAKNADLTIRPLIILDYARYFLLGIAASLGLPMFFKAVKL